MTSLSLPHHPGPYGLLLDTQEPLLACLSLLLFAVGFYLVWPGIALCYRQLRMSAGWLAAPVQRIQPAQPARTPGEGASAARPVHLWSAPDHPRALGSRLARQVKLASRYLLHPALTRRWLDFWNLSATHRALAVAAPRLLDKVYRPYQSLQLSRAERLALLTSHYDFIIRKGLAPLVLRAARQAVPVACFAGKSGDRYEVRLAAIDSLTLEGELALHLYHGDQHLFSTAFSVCAQEDGWELRVGCLQGPRGQHTRERVRHATRDLFGLRPKALMIRLVRALGVAHGCARVVLVSNAHRVARHHCRREHVHADYDAFWQELGAARRSDGDYELPCDEAVTDINALPSRKRAEARQRLALTQQAALAMRCALVRPIH